MAEYSPYISAALSVHNGEICWGRGDCLLCDGRGWSFVDVENGESSSTIRLAACTCSVPHTVEDSDRLNERLFLIAHFYRVEDMEEIDECCAAEPNPDESN